MKERLTIRNFGPITDMDVQIRTFTIFIGSQGSGKSTVAKVLTICHDVNWYLQILDKDKDILEPFKKFCIDEYFRNNTYIRYLNDSGEVEIVYQEGEFQLNFDGLTEKEAKDLFSRKILEANKGFLTRMGIVDVDDVGIGEKYAPLLRANARTMLYVPAERNLVGTMSNALASMMAAKIPLYDALVEYMSVFEKAKNEFKEYYVPFLDVSFSMSDGVERIWLGQGESKRTPLPLHACSSGLQSVLPLLMSLDYSLNTVCFDAFVLEEPEQNLFPSNQRELINHLAEVYNAMEVYGMVFTTHSPYILSCMNVVMMAGKLINDSDLYDEVVAITGENHYLDPSMVSAYRLDPQADEFCVNLINPKTGLIGINPLDVASEFIGEDFDRLYQLYVKMLRKK